MNVASTKETIGRRTTHDALRCFFCLFGVYIHIIDIYIMAQWTKKSLEPWKMVVAAEGAGGGGGRAKTGGHIIFFKDCVIE